MKQKNMLLLAIVLVVWLAAGELVQDRHRVDPIPTLSLVTQTATASCTPGWWDAVATWTPSPTGLPATGTATAGEATPTPELDIPPVRTLETPTTRPTWTPRP